jgi:YD repeat-containing protein
MASIEFAGRVWSYEYAQNPPEPTATGILLRAVQSPVGSRWEYQYNGEDLTQIRSPHGGTVDFTYRTQQFTRYNFADIFCFAADPYPAPPPPLCPVETRVVETRTEMGDPQRRWNYEYDVNPHNPWDGFNENRVTSPDGVTTTFRYAGVSADFELVRRTVRSPNSGPILEEELREYQPLGLFHDLVKKVTLERGGISYVTENTYDLNALLLNFGRPTKVEEYGGGLHRTTERQYLGGGGWPTLFTGDSVFVTRLSQETVTVANETPSFTRTWQYTGTGFLYSQNDFGVVTEFDPDVHGNVLRLRKGNTETTFGYSYGVVNSIDTKEHVSTTRSINLDGTIASETTNGLTTTFVYDALSRITETHPPGANAIVTEYDPDGRWVRSTRDLLASTTYFDEFGRVVGTENSPVAGPGASVKTSVAYDEEGRKVFVSLPYTGNPAPIPGTVITYDFLGRVTKQKKSGTAAGEEVTTTYGPNGDITITDENGHATTQHWLAFGAPGDARLVGITDAAGSEWSYEYNPLGKLTRVTPPGGNPNQIRSWTYNGSNQLTSEYHPESDLVDDFRYDAAGNLSHKRDKRGTEFDYDYDLDGRLWRVRENGPAGSRTTQFEFYPGTDQRRRATTPAVTTNYHYDTAGRLDVRTDAFAQKAYSQTYEYDGNDNLRRLKYGATRRVIEYGYDFANRVTSAVDVTPGNSNSINKNYATGIQDHPSGAPVQYSTGNTLTHVLEFDPVRYWPKRIQHGGALEIKYDSYDGVGN